MGSWVARHRRGLEALVGVALFLAAALALRQALRALTWDAVWTSIRALPASQVLAASALALCSRALLIGYDWLGLRILAQPLAFRRIAVASSVAYSFSHNLGFAALSGATARFKLYSRWGVPGKTIARLVAFTETTVWLGFLPLGGLLFLADPDVLPERLREAPLKGMAALLMATGLGYVLLSWRRRAPLRLWRLELPLPGPKLALAQVVLSATDWVLTASVLYVLLPPDVRPAFALFVGLFLAGQVAGMASQVPGGIGVFESIVLYSLEDKVPLTSLTSALVVYRCMYYLMPLMVSVPIFGVLLGKPVSGGTRDNGPPPATDAQHPGGEV